MPDLPSGLEGRTGFVQALVRDSDTGRLMVSSPAPIVVLDQTF